MKVNVRFRRCTSLVLFAFPSIPFLLCFISSDELCLVVVPALLGLVRALQGTSMTRREAFWHLFESGDYTGGGKKWKRKPGEGESLEEWSFGAEGVKTLISLVSSLSYFLIRLLAVPRQVYTCSQALIASTSAAAPRLCLLQLLLPDCIHFSCCSPIASTSAAAPRLRATVLALFCRKVPADTFLGILCGVQGSEVACITSAVVESSRV